MLLPMSSMSDDDEDVETAVNEAGCGTGLGVGAAGTLGFAPDVVAPVVAEAAVAVPLVTAPGCALVPGVAVVERSA